MGAPHPIVLMTGRPPIHTQTADQLGQAHRLTISAVLQKPVPLEQLRAVLGRRRAAPDTPRDRQTMRKDQGPPGGTVAGAS